MRFTQNGQSHQGTTHSFFYAIRNNIYLIFSTVLHRPEYDYQPSEGEVSPLPLPHGLRIITYHRNQFPSWLLAAGL